MKYTANPTPFDIRSLLQFLDDHPEKVRGVLVHTGGEIKWLHSKVIAVPWWWLDM
ncbi:MAG: hypothetical protein M0017_04715 [Desulfobacteraceae bacterium]|nr:hypothetical protein [Desulfobacteraceae bacterium]